MIDKRILRLLWRRPMHAYALAQEGLADRATVYRRVAAMARAGLVVARREPGQGPQRRVLRLTEAGEDAIRGELREAMRLLLEGFDADAPRPPASRKRSAVRAPVVFVTGSRVSGVEMRIARSLSQAHPRLVHMVVPPGCDVQPAPGSPVMEAPWGALPFRDEYARTLFVNELPPARGLGRAVQEWARVLSPGGALYVVAPAPLPRGIDPFVDYFAKLQDELYPDQAGAPAPERVTDALRRALAPAHVECAREANQNVWIVRRHERVATKQ